MIEETAEAMLTMVPPPCPIIAGRKPRVTWYMARTLRRKEASKSSGGQSRIVP
jgi:hypothetical protein